MYKTNKITVPKKWLASNREINMFCVDMMRFTYFDMNLIPKHGRPQYQSLEKVKVT